MEPTDPVLVWKYYFEVNLLGITLCLAFCPPSNFKFKQNNNIILLFPVGGRDDSTELSSAECFDPETNQWSPVVAMNSRRSGVGLAVVNSQLLAVGGFDGTTYLKTIEVLDSNNQWRMYGGMNYRRLGGGVGVVKVPLCDTIGC